MHVLQRRKAEAILALKIQSIIDIRPDHPKLPYAERWARALFLASVILSKKHPKA
jgi:hypothetical protein